MSSKKKFVFECQESADPPCFKCCTGRVFNIYFEDLERWIKDQSIMRVFPQISVQIADNIPVLRFNFNEDGSCPMLVEKQCSIAYSKPINCEAIPLGYNGNNFFVQYKECEGLGKGEMTKDRMEEMKSIAMKDHEAKTKTALLMPYLMQFMTQFIQMEMMKQSEEMMKSMDPEKRAELEKLINENRDKQVQDAMNQMSPEDREKLEKLIKEKEAEMKAKAEESSAEKE